MSSPTAGRSRRPVSGRTTVSRRCPEPAAASATCRSRTLAQEIRDATRLTDVLSRLRVDAGRIASGAGHVRLLTVARACRACVRTAACDRWIATHAEGSGQPIPRFCRFAAFLRTLDPRG